MTDSAITAVDLPGGVRVLTMDRPPANAISPDFLRSLDTRMAEATTSDHVRAVVLTGAGRFFSGGFDFAAERDDSGNSTEMVDLYNQSHRALLAIPKPTVALVNGHAVAGGLVLALACDHVVAGDHDYRVGLTEVAVGAGFPVAAMEIVRLRLDHRAASTLMLGADLHPSTSLVDFEVVSSLTPAAGASEAAIALATRLAGYSRDSYAHSKSGLISEAVAAIDAETAAERDASQAVWLSEESKAARAAIRDTLGVGRGSKESS